MTITTQQFLADSEPFKLLDQQDDMGPNDKLAFLASFIKPSLFKQFQEKVASSSNGYTVFFDQLISYQRKLLHLSQEDKEQGFTEILRLLNPFDWSQAYLKKMFTLFFSILELTFNESVKQAVLANLQTQWIVCFKDKEVSDIQMNAACDCLNMFYTFRHITPDQLCEMVADLSITKNHHIAYYLELLINLSASLSDEQREQLENKLPPTLLEQPLYLTYIDKLLSCNQKRGFYKHLTLLLQAINQRLSTWWNSSSDIEKKHYKNIVKFLDQLAKKDEIVLQLIIQELFFMDDELVFEVKLNNLVAEVGIDLVMSFLITLYEHAKSVHDKEIIEKLFTKDSNYYIEMINGGKNYFREGRVVFSRDEWHETRFDVHSYVTRLTKNLLSFFYSKWAAKKTVQMKIMRLIMKLASLCPPKSDMTDKIADLFKNRIMAELLGEYRGAVSRLNYTEEFRTKLLTDIATGASPLRYIIDKQRGFIHTSQTEAAKTAQQVALRKGIPWHTTRIDSAAPAAAPGSSDFDLIEENSTLLQVRERRNRNELFSQLESSESGASCSHSHNSCKEG